VEEMMIFMQAGILHFAIESALIWAPSGLQELVCTKNREAGLQSYIRPVAQADMPAGPDGIR